MVLTPVVIRLGWRLKLTDMPNVRKVHSEPVPRIGGLAIYVAMMCLILPVLFLPNKIGDAFRAIQVQLTALLFAGTTVFIVGLIDDVRHLRSWTKLFVQVVAAIVVCSAGIRIESIAVGEWFKVDFRWFSWPLTILWIAGITNAVNLSDGLDGLAAGISAITCGVIAIFAVSSGQVIMAVIMLALLGALTGFLCFNFNPAKVFLGDSGSMFVGFIISTSSVMCYMKSYAFVGLALPVLALGVPIFDTLISILRRFLSRRSIFAPDRSHFHHRLLQLGFRQRHAVIVIYIATLVVTCLGMFMIAASDIGALLIFACILMLVLLLFRVVGSVRLRETIAGFKRRFGMTRQMRKEISDFEEIQLQFEEASTLSSWLQAIFRAADRLDFVWLSLKATSKDGDTHTYVWLAPDSRPSLTDVIIMTVPVCSSQSNVSVEFEVAISKDGSLEAVGRRILLFGRLIDEHSVPTIRITDSGSSIERLRS